MNRADAHAEIDRLFNSYKDSPVSVVIVSVDEFDMGSIYGHEAVSAWKKQGSLQGRMDKVCDGMRTGLNYNMLLNWMGLADGALDLMDKKRGKCNG